MPEAIFDKIQAALNTLDNSTDTRIQGVEDRLQKLGLTVETYLAEPADVWNDLRLHLGYARIAGRYGLVVRRIRGEEATVEPLRAADRTTRIAVVDKLPDLLNAIEAELRKRSARLVSAEPERAPAPAKPAAQATPAPAKPATQAAPAPSPQVAALASKPAATAAPGVALPPLSEVDAPLNRASGGNGGVHTAPANQDSVDHMFRLFSRKGK
jgi:hypothetical protein